ncbi:protein kinase, putative [Drepanopeziza brunnea f. sp. 'multigermtubi' MB_m1]|uniref:Protein kinase, putative n=1 Tax=Marssonina brunnea f. sp. multigermtubi (strain MB_m1) TaxID=1072389 RepID=K1X0F7_MARBU|nr:protein kinase, putative [Drepanopeziza brunnea f. sp. 'multigermtubi' MB_m1]EKD14358.1 protein kinase, putative [Drepanopeziza brunnea f. sp. 'multigermtubi' MB_m1]
MASDRISTLRPRDVYEYEPDGHHPIHLGDTYGRNGRYRVIHKLGSGSDAEVSSDNCPELRVNQIRESLEQNADECSGAGLFLDQMSLGFFHASGDADQDLRALGLQVTKAITFLYRRGICHGGLDGLNEIKYCRFWAVQSSILSSTHLTSSIMGIRPLTTLKASLPSDIWGLGCTIFETRTGRTLFCPFDDDDEYLFAFIEALCMMTKIDENGMAIPVTMSIPKPVNDEKNKWTSTVHPSFAVNARSLAKIAPGFLVHVGLWSRNGSPPRYSRDRAESLS